ncbi:MAG: O-methyltransferase [Bacteroides sp.]|nr:O-methyltransferase [Bacteroides sp.]
MTPALENYIHSHISSEPPELYNIDRQTNLRLVNGRMCSGHIQGRLLKMLTTMIRPKRVLELGTFSGYSALCIAEGIADDATIDTIEVDDELEEFILHNLALSPHGSKVHLHIGDALEVMKQWSGAVFDLVFIDADKRRYVDYLNAALPLLRKGGYIIADNTLWDGHVVADEKHSSQTLGIMAFNDLTAHHPDLETAMIPMRDGLTILRKINETAPSGVITKKPGNNGSLTTN